MNRACELCTIVDRDVLTRLSRYADASIVGRYAVMDRCRDDVACRARVEAAGDEWPLLTTAEARRAS